MQAKTSSFFSRIWGEKSNEEGGIELEDKAGEGAFFAEGEEGATFREGEELHGHDDDHHHDGRRFEEERADEKGEEPGGESTDEERQKVHSLEEAIEGLGFGKYQVLVFFFCGLLWMADAMETMLLLFVSNAAQCEWDLCPASKAFLSSLVFLGMLFGAPFWGYVADVWGRKKCFSMVLVFTLVFGLASALAPYFWLLLISRGLVGFGIGGAHIAFGMCAEWMPNRYRGKVLILFALFWTLGTLSEVALAWLVLSSLGWRWLLGLSALPMLVLLAMLPLVTESPRFLYATEQYQALGEVFSKVAAWNGRQLPSCGTSLVPYCPDPEIDTAGSNWKKLLRLFAPATRRRTIYLFIIWFADAAIYYGVFLLVSELMQMRYGNNDSSPNTNNDSSIPGSTTTSSSSSSRSSSSISVQREEDGCGCQGLITDTQYLSILTSTVGELPGLAVAAFLFDRIGRTWTQTAFFYLTGIMALYLVVPSSPLAEAIIFFAFRSSITSAFQATYAATPELYPTPIRATALGSCAAVSRVGAMVAPLISQLLIRLSPVLALVIFAVFAFLSGTLSFLLPETLGQSLSEHV